MARRPTYAGLNKVCSKVLEETKNVASKLGSLKVGCLPLAEAL